MDVTVETGQERVLFRFMRRPRIELRAVVRQWYSETLYELRSFIRRPARGWRGHRADWGPEWKIGPGVTVRAHQVDELVEAALALKEAARELAQKSPEAPQNAPKLEQ